MDLLPLLHQKIILGVKAIASRDLLRPESPWVSSFHLKCKAGVFNWKRFTTGPHDLLATREAGESGKRCCLTTVLGWGIPEHERPRSDATGQAKQVTKVCYTFGSQASF